MKHVTNLLMTAALLLTAYTTVKVMTVLATTQGVVYAAIK